MAFSTMSSISSLFNKKIYRPPIVYTDFSELSMRYIYDNTNCYCAYNASNYDVSTKTFTDMSKSTNTRNGNITFPATSTAPTLVRRIAAGNGANVSNFPVVAGVGAGRAPFTIPPSNCTVIAPSNTTLKDSTNFTIIFVARKKTSPNNWTGSIFGAAVRFVVLGWWNNNVSGSIFTGNGWFGTSTSGNWDVDQYTTNFFITVFRPTTFRTNNKSTAISPITFPGLEINPIFNDRAGLDFEIAEILVFKTELPDTATGTLSVANVVSTLSSLYGI